MSNSLAMPGIILHHPDSREGNIVLGAEGVMHVTNLGNVTHGSLRENQFVAGVEEKAAMEKTRPSLTSLADSLKNKTPQLAPAGYAIDAGGLYHADESGNKVYGAIEEGGAFVPNS